MVTGYRAYFPKFGHYAPDTWKTLDEAILKASETGFEAFIMVCYDGMVTATVASWAPKVGARIYDDEEE